MTSHPKASIIVPTFAQEFLRGTLDALCLQDASGFEVIVVENGERCRETESWIRGYGDRLDLKLVFTDPPGLNRARNAGAAMARGGIVVFTDDDCVPEPDWIGQLLLAHERYPDTGVVGGRVILADQGIVPGWTLPFENLLSRIDWGSTTRPLARGEWLAGANLSFKRSLFEKAGRFNPDIGMQGRDVPQLGNDEIECIRRAAKLGRPGVVYSADAVVAHRIATGRRTAEYLEQRNYGQGRSDVVQILLDPDNGDPLESCRGKVRYYTVKYRLRDFRSKRNRSQADEDARNGIRVILALFTGIVDELRSSCASFSPISGADTTPGRRGNSRDALSRRRFDSRREIALIRRLMAMREDSISAAADPVLSAFAHRIEIANGLQDRLLGRGRPGYRKRRAGVAAGPGTPTTTTRIL